MNIDSIKNGIVIDHITAGKGMELYRLLKLDQLDCSVALIKNAVSQKMGKKDIIKIDTDFRVDMDILATWIPASRWPSSRDGETGRKAPVDPTGAADQCDPLQEPPVYLLYGAGVAPCIPPHRPQDPDLPVPIL